MQWLNRGQKWVWVWLPLAVVVQQIRLSSAESLFHIGVRSESLSTVIEVLHHML